MSMLVRELGIVRGPFRVLQRTDGLFAVVDERRPLGNRTIVTHSELKLAIETLHGLEEVQSPR